MFKCETGIVKSAARMQQVSSRDGQAMLLDLERTGPQQSALAVWDQSARGRPMQWRCNGAATITLQPTYGAFLRPDIPLRTHAYMRVADRFTASTPPWTALFSSEAVQTRLIGAGVNPHSGELGTETMPLRTA